MLAVKSYQITDLDEFPPGWIEALDRLEISDAITADNADAIAAWAGGDVYHTEQDRYMIVWDTGAAIEGHRLIKRFRDGSVLPESVTAVTAETYDILKRYL